MSGQKPKYSDSDLPAIQKLLETLCTRKEIEDMLRAAGAPFSAPKKQDVIRIRVPEALHDSKRIDLADVAALLREAEEHGLSTSFLYDCSKTKAGQLLAGRSIICAVQDTPLGRRVPLPSSPCPRRSLDASGLSVGLPSGRVPLE